MQRSPTGGRRRSGFAAAFFSLLFPGLGHAYLGAWPRALAWGFVPVLVVAVAAGLLASPGTREMVYEVALTDDGLTALLALVALDLVYRLACVLDAWRLARRSSAASVGLAAASVAGLLAVVAVLGVSHLAAARPVMLAMNLLDSVGGAGDEELDPSFDPELIASLRPVTPPPTATPDPSVPVAPTPTPEPTPTRGPAWDEGGRLSILLIGEDGGRPGGGNLTDTLIVATVDTRTKQSAFISIPRDMEGIPIPPSLPAYQQFGGVYPYPINTIYLSARINPDLWAPGADKAFGMVALKSVIGHLYDLKIDYYVAVDLRGFRAVIDSLGGTMIDVQNPVYDYHYPFDDGLRGHQKLYVPPGIQLMSGREALAYARARKLTSDFDRAARQQRVVTSLRDQADLPSLLSPGVLQSMLKTVRSYIRTDIPPSKLAKLAQLAQEIDLDDRISLVLTPPTYGTECYLQAACPTDYQLVADPARIRSAVRDVFRTGRDDARLAQRLLEEGAVVHVVNGTRTSNLRTTRLADVLAERGLDATVPPVNGGAADRDDYRETVIYAWNGAQTTRPEAGQVLARALGVRLTPMDDPTATADYTVVYGSETEVPG